MSFDGQVLCQRMLIGPWALTTAGAAIVAAGPAAATFKKRRRGEGFSLGDVVMASSPGLNRSLVDRLLLIGSNSRGLRRGLASLVAVMRPYDAPQVCDASRERQAIMA